MQINESLGFILGVTSKNLKHELEYILKDYNLTTSQWVILKLLSEKDGITQVDISMHLKVDKVTVGSVINKLIEKELVIREVSTTDKRGYNILIMDEGKNIVSKVTEHAVQINERALLGFSRLEVEKLNEYLNRINMNIKGEK